MAPVECNACATRAPVTHFNPNATVMGQENKFRQPVKVKCAEVGRIDATFDAQTKGLNVGDVVAAT